MDNWRRSMHLQEHYQTLFERAFDGIFQTSRDGHYLTANAALAKNVWISFNH
jgi:PAS domain-containing protein